MLSLPAVHHCQAVLYFSFEGTLLLPLLSVFVIKPHLQKEAMSTGKQGHYKFLTAAGLAQSVERLTAEREVAGLIPGAGLILRVLK